MKKRFTALVFLTLCLILIFFVCSCRNENNERTNIANGKEEPVLCEHQWALKGKLVPTCISEGKTTIECAFCGEVKTVKTAKAECEYDIHIEWDEGYSTANLMLTCPLESSHSTSVKCDIKAITVSKTCTQKGSTTKIASATYNGITYTDKYVIDYGFDGHYYLYSYKLITDNCEDGIIRTLKCKNCDKVVEDIISSDHYTDERIKLYSFDEIGLCAGSFVNCDSCLCGERKRNYTMSLGGCLVTENYTSQTDGDITYDKRELQCVRCGASAIWERAKIYQASTDRYYDAYEITTYKLNEEIILVNAKTDFGVHSKFNHELEYTYIPPTKKNFPYTKKTTCKSCSFFNESYHYHFGNESYELLFEKCTDGVKRTIDCEECKNVIEYIYYDHQTKAILESYRIECGTEHHNCHVYVLECYCGEKLLNVVTNTGFIDSIITKKTVEKTDGAMIHTQTTTYEYHNIHVIETTNILLVNGEWVKTNVTTSVKLDEQTIISTTVPYFVVLGEDELKLFANAPQNDQKADPSF